MRVITSIKKPCHLPPATKLWVFSTKGSNATNQTNENRPNTTPTNPIPHTQLHTHHFEPPQFPVTHLTLDPVPISIPCSLEIAITPEILQLSMSQKVHRLMQKAIINKNSKNNSRQHPSSRSHGFKSWKMYIFSARQVTMADQSDGSKFLQQTLRKILAHLKVHPPDPAWQKHNDNLRKHHEKKKTLGPPLANANLSWVKGCEELSLSFLEILPNVSSHHDRDREAL